MSVNVSELKPFVKQQVLGYSVKVCLNYEMPEKFKFNFLLYKYSVFLFSQISFKPGVPCSEYIFLELPLLVSEPLNVSCDIPSV